MRKGHEEAGKASGKEADADPSTYDMILLWTVEGSSLDLKCECLQT